MQHFKKIKKKSKHEKTEKKNCVNHSISKVHYTTQRAIISYASFYYFAGCGLHLFIARSR